MTERLVSPQADAGPGDRPVLQRTKPGFWPLHLSGWFFYYLLVLFDNLFLLGRFNYFGDHIVYLMLVNTLMGILLTWPLRYLFRRCWALSMPMLGGVVVLASAVVSSIWIVPKNLLLYYSGGDSLLRLSSAAELEWAHLFMMVSATFFVVLVWSSLYFAINYHFRLLESQEKALQAARLGHRAQIRMLRYQINPHFLFNTLNAISTLVVREDKVRINKMLSQLASFLRFSLDSDPEQKVRLEEEIRALMLYLDIEKTRFGSRLAVSLSISRQAESALVPGLLLQPLVENCIKHAIAKMSQGGEIRIRAWVETDLFIEVNDNGPLQATIRPRPGGVGLGNIVERLAVLYQDKQSVEFAVASPSGLRVTLKIPYQLT